MLTEKEKAELVNLMTGVVNTQNATFNGHFEAIRIELLYIKEKGEKTLDQAIKTNGRVNGHDTDIELLKAEKNDRISTCPQREVIQTLVNKDKNKVMRFVYDAVVASVAILACWVSIETAKGFMKEKVAVRQDMTEIKAESKKVDKAQNIDINNNTKAINDQAVEDAFKKSKEEK